MQWIKSMSNQQTQPVDRAAHAAQIRDFGWIKQAKENCEKIEQSSTRVFPEF